jgi:hypothetical protein
MNANNRRSFFKSAGAGLAGVLSLRGLSAAVQESTSPYRRPKVKITDVRTAFVQGMHVRIYTDHQGCPRHRMASSGGAFRYSATGPTRSG